MSEQDRDWSYSFCQIHESERQLLLKFFSRLLVDFFICIIQQQILQHNILKSTYIYKTLFPLPVLRARQPSWRYSITAAYMSTQWQNFWLKTLEFQATMPGFAAVQVPQNLPSHQPMGSSTLNPAWHSWWPQILWPQPEQALRLPKGLALRFGRDKWREAGQKENFPPAAVPWTNRSYLQKAFPHPHLCSTSIHKQKNQD